MFWIWAGFILFVLVMLTLDLCVINRKAHAVKSAEALRWTGVTVILALAFAIVVFYLYKNTTYFDPLNIVDTPIEATDRTKLAWKATTEYLTGWILEYSLSLDNIFVMLLIFRYFRVPQEYQHRVLFWGILGALVMRGIMIAGTSELIKHFGWILYFFGAFLLYTSVKLLFAKEEGVDPEKNFVLRIARKLVPVTPTYEGIKFFTRIPEGTPTLAENEPVAHAAEPSASEPPTRTPPPSPIATPELAAKRTGKFAVTPLFLVLLVVETTDVIFAVDSIPAIFGVTRDPFLVFTSNVFAILGLRSLYFALAAMMDKFRYLKTSLVFVLAFIGVKMLIETYYSSGEEHHQHLIPTPVSLAVILGMLGVGAMASLFASKRERERARLQAPVDDLGEAAVIAYKKGRKVVILVLGLTVLGLSIPIGLLPGPGGIAVAIGGLALLATEFIWARRLLKGLKERTQKIASRADAMISKNPRPWLIPIVLGAFAGLIWLGVHHSPHGPFHLMDWMGPIGPFTSKHVYFAAAGPAIAIGYWSFMTMRRWLQQRRAT